MKALHKQLATLSQHPEFLTVSARLLRETVFLSLAGLILLGTLEALLPGSVSDRLFFPLFVSGTLLLIAAHEYVVYRLKSLVPQTNSKHHHHFSSSLLQSRTFRILGMLWGVALVSISLIGFPIAIIPILAVALLALTYTLFRELLI